MITEDPSGPSPSAYDDTVKGDVVVSQTQTELASSAASDGESGKGASKKFLKRLKKIEKSLIQKEHLHISENPTKVLCVQNGGLGNDVSQDELFPFFSKYGEVEGIVMVPRKPYCFVCYTDNETASTAMEALNGHILKGGQDPSQTVILYLFYVDRAPSNMMPSHEKPPGLIIVEDFISEDLETKLLDFMETQYSQAEATGQMKHRQVIHFGYEFKYGINDVDINDPLSQPIPELCHEFLNKAKNEGLVEFFPDQLTVNQYKAGQGIPPHVDTPAAFEDGIMSLSLGSQAVMDFKHPDGRQLSVLLPRQSLMVMTGDSRYVWSHGITPRKSDIIAASDGTGLTLAHRSTRTSLTFRKVVRERSDQKKSIEGVLLPTSDSEAAALEKEHVQQVYDDIADHFSGTRYKPWPRVIEFLMEQPDYSLLADVGCGNGKCLGANKTFYEIGSDFSKKLAGICHSRGFETCVGDVTSLPFQTSSMDIVLCIAVIHHLATKERRQKAVSEVVRILRKGGKALIYVWAMEQDLQAKPSKYINVNRQKHLTGAGDEGLGETSLDNADNSNSVLANESPTSCKDAGDLHREDKGISLNQDQSYNKIGAESLKETTLKDSLVSDDIDQGIVEKMSSNTLDEAKPIRYKKKEKNEDSENATPNESTPAKDFQNDDNSGNEKVKLHVHVNRTQFKEQDMLVPWQLASKKDKGPQIFHRFYHVFRQGELEAVCKRVPGCAVLKSYYDQGNWCVVLEKL